MSSESIKVSRAPVTGGARERFYSQAVKWIQNTFVRADVWIDAKRGGPLARRPDEAQLQRLRALGLKPERIGWGPLTLRVQKLIYLLDEIERDPPKRILEMGSGASTALFAALGEKYGFEVYSIENHPGSADYVNYLLKGLPCARRVNMQLCGFVRRRLANGERYWWFDADLAQFGGRFDFVFVDAPMGQLAGRLGAVPEIAPYLAEAHRIFLDDSDRPHERSIVRVWQDYFPNLSARSPQGCRDILCLSLSG